MLRIGVAYHADLRKEGVMHRRLPQIDRVDVWADNAASAVVYSYDDLSLDVLKRRVSNV